MNKIFEWIPHNKQVYKHKILDYTYTSQPSINNALPLKFSNIKLVFFILGVLLSAGFLWLLSRWSNKRKSIFLYNVCHIEQATHFLIQQQNVSSGSTIVQRQNKFDIRTRVSCISFNYHERMYLYHQEKQAFLPIRYEQLGIHLDQLQKNIFEPYSSSKRKQMCEYYGQNIINLPIKTKFTVFIEEMLTPYEVFQTYTIILWIYEEYYIFSFILLAYALYTYFQTSNEVIKNEIKLSKQSYFQISCKILTNHQNNNIGAINMNDQGQIEKINQISQQKASFSNSKNTKNKNQMIEEAVQPQIQLVSISKQQSELKKQKLQLEQKESYELDFSKPKKSGSTSHFNKQKQKVKAIEINSKQLLPGDLIILHQGDTVPCDCIILKGQILADQSYITGENYLIRKSELQNFTYRKESQNSFTLYLGTKIAKIKSNMHSSQQSTSPLIMKVERRKSFLVANSLQQSIACNQLTLPNQIVCLVINTNYNTLRGKYLRAIRYQKKQLSTFTLETIYFIYILIALTTFIFLTMYSRLKEGQSSWSMFIIYLDLLSTSIPPTLPTLLSVGINFAQHRLRHFDIACVLPSNILIGGSVDSIILEGHHALGKQYQVQSMMIGTKSSIKNSGSNNNLAGSIARQNDGMAREINGSINIGNQFGQTYSSVEKFYQYHENQLQGIESSTLQLSLQSINKKKEEKNKHFLNGQMFLNSIVSCHSLQYYQNKLQGKPIDKKILQFTSAKVKDENVYQCKNYLLKVQKKLYFKEKQKKMAVVVEIQKNDKEQIVKASLDNKSKNKSDHELIDCKSKLKQDFMEHFSLIDEDPFPRKYQELEDLSKINKSVSEHHKSKINQNQGQKEFSNQIRKQKSLNLSVREQVKCEVQKKSQKVLFIKGVPQKILHHCKKITYPQNSYQYIVDMAQKGFNLICYAYVQLSDQKNDDQIQNNVNNRNKKSSTSFYLQKINENQFTFLGFLVMKQLRYQDNIEAIKSFKKANIKVLLVSQERQLQTSSIAILNNICQKKQLLLCSLAKSKNKIYCKGHVQWQSILTDPLSEFVMEFDSIVDKNSKLSLDSPLYEELFMRRESEQHDKIFQKSIVFSKMQYRHQRNLYSQLDKKANVSFAIGGGGIVSECASLSMELQRNESSLLSSFYTKSKSLMTIFHCLRICRAGLATNFHVFSMMILFSLIQFTTVCILYVNYQSLTDNQTLYEDLFVTFPIFVTLNLTKPSTKLSRQKPLTSFFSLRALISMIGQLILQFFAQLAFILYLLSYPQFKTERDSSKIDFLETGQFRQKSVTVVSLFVLSNYLYLGIVLSTSVSKSFRKPFYTNPWYTVILILLWLYNTLIVLVPSIASDQIRKTNMSDDQEQIVVLAMIYGNLMMVLMYLYQNFLSWVWIKYKQWRYRKANEIVARNQQYQVKEDNVDKFTIEEPI